jgi:hypothetical protein
MDGAAMHFLSTKGVYIEPLWLIEHRQRMQQIQDQLEYNLNPNNIPTWASNDLAREFLKQ